MRNSQIIRLAALELQTIDNSQVVKVAGIVRRLKNWFKRKTDSQYKATVDVLNADAAKIQGTLTALHSELNKLQSAINDGELSEYNISLNNVKEIAAKLWTEIKQTSNDSKDYYTLQDMEVPGFEGWFKKFLPKSFSEEVDLGTIYNKPLKEIKWYSNLAPQQISLRDGGAKQYLFSKTKEALIEGHFATPEEADKLLSNSEDFIKTFQDAVVNGVLIMANIKRPSKSVERNLGGSTEMQITTAPFTIPGSNVIMQAKVDLIDLSTTKSIRNKLSLRRTHYVTILGNKAASKRIEQLKKISFQQEAEYKVTKLDPAKFAQVLREGYKRVFGSDPTLEVLGAGWAQAVLEGGRPGGIINLPNNNIGNIKATDDWIKSGKSYFIKPTTEFSNAGKQENTVPAKWRSYDLPEEGAAGYWKVIGNTHKNAMAWMAAGDPKSASITLGVGGYYTANIPRYTSGVSSIYKEFLTKIAPTMPDLKSAPAPAPGPKPELKDWHDDYSKAEREQILGKKRSSSPAVDEKLKDNKDPDLSNIDSLINTLYADDSGPLEKIVKQAILQERLPISKILIVISSDTASYDEKMQYAKTARHILNKFIDSSTSIHCNNYDKIELQCSVLGTPLTVVKASQALCDCISDGMLLAKNINIQSMAVPGFISKYAEIDAENLYKKARTSRFNQFLEK
jgi:hypothetical protein